MRFDEAAWFIHTVCKTLDKDPSFANSVLRLLIKDSMNYAQAWSETPHYEKAVMYLQDLTATPQEAMEICRHTSNLVQQKLTTLIPDFSHRPYAGKYLYNFLESNDGQILLRYWEGGAPEPLSPE